MSFDPEEQQRQGPVIRDRRRIDPETGKVRERQETAAPAAAEPRATEPAEPAEAEIALAERTADLQRLQAEYLNYKHRVDRERENTRTTAVATTLGALLPVLDDIVRAREHQELTGGFKAVAESLERTVAQLGLTSFGEPGDPFDPRIHEALMHSYSDGVDGPVCQAIIQVGYSIGERIVRPARVAVAEPPVASAAASVADSAASGTAPEGGADDRASHGDEPADGAPYDDNENASGDGPAGSAAGAGA